MKHITLPVLDEPEKQRISQEILEVDALADGRVRLLHSPAFVWGIAKGDVIELDAAQLSGYTVIERSGNVAVVVRLPGVGAAQEYREWLQRQVEAIGGNCEGGPQKALVFSIPVTAGFERIRRIFDEFCATEKGSSWWYGNVYGPGDRPLDWWREFISEEPSRR